MRTPRETVDLFALVPFKAHPHTNIKLLCRFRRSVDSLCKMFLVVGAMVFSSVWSSLTVCCYQALRLSQKETTPLLITEVHEERSESWKATGAKAKQLLVDELELDPKLIEIEYVHCKEHLRSKLTGRVQTIKLVLFKDMEEILNRGKTQRHQDLYQWVNLRKQMRRVTLYFWIMINSPCTNHILHQWAYLCPYFIFMLTFFWIIALVFNIIIIYYYFY